MDGKFPNVEIGGYSIGAWLFLAFIIFVVVYPIYAVIRSTMDNHRSNAATPRPTAERPRADNSAQHVASSPKPQSTRPRRTEDRRLTFRREAAPRGVGAFTLGYPNPQNPSGKEWTVGWHRWFDDDEVPTESRLNATAIEFIRDYYPSAEWVGEPENYIERAEDWPVVTTGVIRVEITDHANRSHHRN